MYEEFDHHNHENCLKRGWCDSALHKLAAVAAVHRQEIKVFRCLLCPRTFASGQALGGHVASHPKCNRCSQRFTDQHTLLAHQRSHTLAAQVAQVAQAVPLQQCPSCRRFFPVGIHRNCDVVFVS